MSKRRPYSKIFGEIFLIAMTYIKLIIIERQLNSLVIEDDGTQEDTAELLQQTSDQLDVETQGHVALSHHTRPVSSFTTEASCRSRSSTTDEDHTSLSHRSLAHRDYNDSASILGRD
ncbi:hypothetical protein V8B55DRAFT_1431688 [Mucor lusitanicus]